MLTSILVLAVIIGLLFRSLYGFYFSLFALFLLIYPLATISVLVIACAITFFTDEEPNHDQSTKHHIGSDRDDHI